MDQERINLICISESFNTNISHQLFDHKIAFMNSQYENTNSKSDFVLKKTFKTIVLKISVIKNHLRLKIPYTHNTNF